MGRGDSRVEKGGKGGVGGVTPPPPPAKRRQEGEEGGEVPPTVKAKSREAPSSVSAPSQPVDTLKEREAAASKILESAGYSEFPDLVPNCGGTIGDIHSARISISATKQHLRAHLSAPSQVLSWNRRCWFPS